MKTPSEWQDEAVRSGPDDQLSKISEPRFIEAIQRDALSESTCELYENEIRRHKHNIEVYRERWLEARKYLRAANKGAERNAIALQLAASRINSMNDPLEGRVWQWLMFSDQDLQLRMGELSVQEIRNIRACLRAILGTSKLSQKTNQ